MKYSYQLALRAISCKIPSVSPDANRINIQPNVIGIPGTPTPPLPRFPPQKNRALSKGFLTTASLKCAGELTLLFSDIARHHRLFLAPAEIIPVPYYGNLYIHLVLTTEAEAVPVGKKPPEPMTEALAEFKTAKSNVKNAKSTVHLESTIDALALRWIPSRELTYPPQNGILKIPCRVLVLLLLGSIENA